MSVHPSRRQRRSPVAGVSIAEQDPVEEALRLRRLIVALEGVIDDLWIQARSLRQELAIARGDPGSVADDSPPVESISVTDADPIGELLALQRSFEKLHEVADSLWFETQWLRAQLAARRELPDSR